MSDSRENADVKRSNVHTAWIVGAVAAAVSAATVAYVFYRRAKQLTPHVEGVQQLLDRCHDQVRAIEEKIGQLNDFTVGAAS